MDLSKSSWFYQLIQQYQTLGGKCVFSFGFSDADQFLIIFNCIDLLPLFVPYALMNDILKSTRKQGIHLLFTSYKYILLPLFLPMRFAKLWNWQTVCLKRY